jgi:hypothetical protein
MRRYHHIGGQKDKNIQQAEFLNGHLLFALVEADNFRKDTGIYL